MTLEKADISARLWKPCAKVGQNKVQLANRTREPPDTRCQTMLRKCRGHSGRMTEAFSTWKLNCFGTAGSESSDMLLWSSYKQKCFVGPHVS